MSPINTTVYLIIYKEECVVHLLRDYVSNSRFIVTSVSIISFVYFLI